MFWSFKVKFITRPFKNSNAIYIQATRYRLDPMSRGTILYEDKAIRFAHASQKSNVFLTKYAISSVHSVTFGETNHFAILLSDERHQPYSMMDFGCSVVESTSEDCIFIQ